MSVFIPFLVRNFFNYHPKIQMLTNVKTSPSQENINIDDDVFVLIRKCILKGLFVFGSIVFFVIFSTLLAKNCVFVELFDPFKCILA